ncbi:MAG: HK97 family phage prohead protease [Betaproteobacteria bacterium]|nr:HK97 family phage prohead protease [Betaproteobacteria bacterium]
MLAHKTLSLSDCDIKMDGGEGRFSGYASVFGGVDSYGDTIVKGAYEYTLKKNGKPKMFLQHESWSLPIGKYLVAKEDDHGLFVEGELTPGLSKAQDTYAALKHGTLDGLSIGYMLKSGDYEELADGTRLIKRVSDLVEVSPVVFPADSAARVDLASVKTAVDTIETIRDFERFLRDAGGLSKGLTEALVSRAKIVFSQGDPDLQPVEAKAMAELMERINRAAARIPQ